MELAAALNHSHVDIEQDDLAQTVRREAEGAEADPFDDAMVAAVAGMAEAMKAEAEALADLEMKAKKLARRAPR